MFKTLLAAVLMLAVVYTGCKKDDNNNPTGPTQGGTNEGPAVVMGSGNARSYVTTDASGNATEVGIKVTASALTNLPAADSEYVLALPQQANVTAFNHFAIDWNAHGHVPTPIYGVPHFDFHFYMISQATRDSIAPVPDSTMVPASAVPPDYAPLGGIVPVPRMGVHYLDSTSAEFHGSPFTQTLIYGYWHGRMIFVEPMITLAYLQTRPSVNQALKLPAAYPKSGVSYPTRYTVSYDSTKAEYTVALTGMTLR